MSLLFQIQAVAPLPKQYHNTSPFTTVSMCADGKFFYWFWCPGLVADKSCKGQNLYVESFRFDVSQSIILTHWPLRGCELNFN